MFGGRRRLGGYCQWVLDGVCETSSGLQPLGFDSLALLGSLDTKVLLHPARNADYHNGVSQTPFSIAKAPRDSRGFAFWKRLGFSWKEKFIAADSRGSDGFFVAQLWRRLVLVS